jgi:cytochrome c biogenesis protein CcmG/thiol:disulfide interchange protein DsbE
VSKREWAALAVLAALMVGSVLVVRSWRERRGQQQEAASARQAGPIQLYRDPVAIPDFTLTDLDGKPIASSALKGKVVLMNFWATWCPPCRAEIPDLIALQNKYPDKIVVVGVSEDDIPAAEVKKFVAEQKMNYPVAMATQDLHKIFKGVVALPTTFVIDPDGRIEQKHVGMLSPQTAEAEARVLAGLDLNASVERIENSDKVRLDNAAQSRHFPGIDLSHFSDTQTKAVVEALIAESCTCGCRLSVAECRLDDPTCPVSLPLAKEIVKKYSAEP